MKKRPELLTPKELAFRNQITVRQAQRMIRTWRDSRGLISGYPTLIQAFEYGLIYLERSDVERLKG